MPDPTGVAMRLGAIADLAIIEFDPIGAEDLDFVRQVVIARALDDAGVREAVEHLEWIKNFYGFTRAGDRAKEALSALTGETQEVSDG